LLWNDCIQQRNVSFFPAKIRFFFELRFYFSIFLAFLMPQGQKNTQLTSKQPISSAIHFMEEKVRKYLLSAFLNNPALFRNNPALFRNNPALSRNKAGLLS